MERRQAAKVRRARASVVGAAVVAALVLVVWFPAGALLRQRAAIAATAHQLSQLQQQDRQLSSEQKALGSPAEIQRIAREQYQLVAPGERAFRVLPPNDTGASSGSYQGDPANQPLVSPSATAELPPASVTASSANPSQPASAGAGTSGAGSHHGSSGSQGNVSSGSSPGFLGRVAQSLEFWR
jgi:cell division protein FtsB